MEKAPDLYRFMADSPNEKMSFLMRETVKALRAG